jgi:drug/metabolite transporter (DMT)-like permease
MKNGLRGLSAFQVASIRILSAGLVLLPYSIKALKIIPFRKIPLIAVSGMLGNLLPAYLFCIAEEQIDSGLAGVLNALTPIFTIIIAFLAFKTLTPLVKVLGIFIAFGGSFLLFLSQPDFKQDPHTLPVLLIVLATIMYGTNVNLVSRYLAAYSSPQIVGLALLLNAIPAFIILFFSGFFNMYVSGEFIFSGLSSVVLGVFGTAVASIFFYKLIQRAGIVFSSMVTYAMPFVALFWGFMYGERIGFFQAISMIIILMGVYLANWRKRSAGVNTEVRSQ